MSKANEYKRKLLRYCLLSWTMVLTQVSPALKAQFASAEKKDGLIMKKLATEEEVGALKGPFINYVDRILRIFVHPPLS